MSKNVKITASVLITENSEKREKESLSVTNLLHKNFGRREIGNIQNIGEFISFDVNVVTCVPMLIGYFPTLQIYVNGNGVNMAVFKK